MTPAITLEQFAEVVATSEDDQWAHHLIDAVTALVPETKAAALFLQNEQMIRPIAAKGKPPSLRLSDLQALPRRVGQSLLLPIPAFARALLWLKTPQRADEVLHRLRGWLSVASLGLARHEQFREAERQRTARDHFFSMVNHDLKSPLSSVKAMADLLLRKLQRGTLDPTTEEGKGDLLERLTFLSRRVKDLAMLIDEIGDVSIIERGRLEVNLQPTELTSILQGTLERLEAERPDRSVVVEQPEHTLRIKADPFRITQLFYILLKNALDYSDPSTSVRVRLREEAGRAAIEIEDEGRGIALEQQARLFKEYGRSIQEMPSGLGVGLYIASALVGAHAGTLSLESTPDRGTTVHLRLPLHERESRQN